MFKFLQIPNNMFKKFYRAYDMHKKVNLIFKILGICFIVLGIVLTIIPLFKFDSDTFKLSSALLSGIGFPFVGIVLIIISTILGINDENNLVETDTEETKSTKVSKATENRKVVSKSSEEITEEKTLSSRSVQTENEALETMEENNISSENNVNLEENK